jgi:hypothetical protein
MRQEVRESTTRHQARMQSVVGVMTVVFWAGAALMVVFVALSWAVPALSNERTFNLLSGAVLVLIMISSGFLFWQERGANRQEMRRILRESRDIPVEGRYEWTPRAWLYVIALGVSFFLSWYLLPYLFFSWANH